MLIVLIYNISLFDYDETLSDWVVSLIWLTIQQAHVTTVGTFYETCDTKAPNCCVVFVVGMLPLLVSKTNTSQPNLTKSAELNQPNMAHLGSSEPNITQLNTTELNTADLSIT